MLVDANRKTHTMFTQYNVTKFIITSIVIAILFFGLNFLGQTFTIEWLRKLGLLLFFVAFVCAFVGVLMMIPLVIRDWLKK